MDVNWYRIKYDFEYILLNRFVNRIPVWSIRKYIYKQYGMQIGDFGRIGIGTVILNPRGIVIGNRTVINENCFIDGRGGINIGRDTSISTYSKIISASHDPNSKDFKYIESKTKIGEKVWIGTGAIILDGSVIGDKAVIGAGSVVKGLVNENSIVIGNPAKEIKKRLLDDGYCRNNFIAYFR